MRFKPRCDISKPEWAYRTMDRMHHLAHNAVFDSLGLDIGQPILLLILSDTRTDGNNRTQKEIAKLLGITPSTVTASIKALEKRGYVTRRVDESDKRRNFVEITDSGMQIAEKCRAAFDSIDNAMYSGFSDEEKDTATKIFNRISMNLAAVVEKEKGGL